MVTAELEPENVTHESDGKALGAKTGQKPRGRPRQAASAMPPSAVKKTSAKERLAAAVTTEDSGSPSEPALPTETYKRVRQPVKRRQPEGDKGGSESEAEEASSDFDDESGPPPKKRKGGVSKPAPKPASSPKAKREAAKYNPHEDGKGPSLDGDWKSQIAECPNDPEKLKFSVWNVNGIRAVLRKSSNKDATAASDLATYLKEEHPDILCINETKIDDAQLEAIAEHLNGYHYRFVHSERKSYAGVAILVRGSSGLEDAIEKQLEGVGDPEHDIEGRTLALVFPKCILVTSYVANAGQGLKRLNYRVEKFDKSVHAYLNKLRAEYDRSVIWCGDLNCAYEEIDIWNSKGNQKSAGHTPQERASFGGFLESGEWVDVWRVQNPGVRRYTFWPARSVKSRIENLGWRLDYFIVSKDLAEKQVKVYIRDLFKGSDHCPLLMTLPRNCVI